MKDEFIKGLMKYGREKGFIQDKPQPNKTYTLVGVGKCIANGNSWRESEVKNNDKK